MYTVFYYESFFASPLLIIFIPFMILSVTRPNLILIPGFLLLLVLTFTPVPALSHLRYGPEYLPYIYIAFYALVTYLYAGIMHSIENGDDIKDITVVGLAINIFAQWTIVPDPNTIFNITLFCLITFLAFQWRKRKD